METVWLPSASVPEEVSQVYFHVVPETSVRGVFVTIPGIVIVGEPCNASEKTAVKVTTEEVFTLLLLSVLVRETEGAVVSTVKVMLCVPATYAFVLLSVPDTVAQ